MSETKIYPDGFNPSDNRSDDKPVYKPIIARKQQISAAQPPEPPNTNGGSGNGKWWNPPQKFIKYILIMWGIFVLGVLSVFGLFIGISYGLLGDLPTFAELESPNNSLASEVYSNDEKLLGRFYVVDRSNVKFDELSPHLVEALIATEDVRFKNHSGIDFRGLVRVFFKTLIQGKNTGGGSTISQQLAKNLFHNVRGGISARIKQKLKEWVIAVKLERSYTKDEIVTMYLNTVPFSNNAHGIKVASQVYFNTSPDSLKVEEAAVLVGMLKGSTFYNPVRNPDNATDRRNVVLTQMEKYGYLMPQAADSLRNLPLVIDFNRQSHNKGPATYFREYVKQYVKDWAQDNANIDGTNYDVFRDGLKIYTTIDAKLQNYAEEAVATHMPELQKQFNDHWKQNGNRPWKDALPIAGKVKAFKLKKSSPWYKENELVYRGAVRSDRYQRLAATGNYDKNDIYKIFTTPVKTTVFDWKAKNYERDTLISPLDSVKYTKNLLHAGFMAMDPQSGHVKAWVGGINHKQFKYDNVRPSSKRQVGSTFKPFVYTVAVQNGWSPCQRIPNQPVIFEEFDNWSPRNAGKYKQGEMVTLKEGLAHSINQVTARLMKQIGPEPVIQMAQSMGVTSQMDPYPSIALGTPDISLFEMVGAYSAFANKGFVTKPVVITRIEDANGNVIQTFPTQQKEVMSEQVAYAMIELLRGVVNTGTSIRLRYKYQLEADIAGKTGTTNDNSDGWFMGLTPQLVAGTWVGGDEKAIHFRTTRLGSGTNMALPIFAEFIKRAYDDPSTGIDPEATFERPGDMGRIVTDCDLFYQAAPHSNYPSYGSSYSSANSGSATYTPPSTGNYNEQFDDMGGYEGVQPQANPNTVPPNNSGQVQPIQSTPATQPPSSGYNSEFE